jgi:lipoprotein-anchoring transpeptidase ErfK/SrfK
MLPGWRTFVVAVALFESGAVAPVAGAAAQHVGAETSPCESVLGSAPVGAPTNSYSWKLGLGSRIAVFDRLPGKGLRPSTWVGPNAAPWLLILAGPHVDQNRCWVRVRLPWRPNSAAGWVNASLGVVKRTQWRIDISRQRRTLTLFKAGRLVRTITTVVGKPSTPTPTGQFAIAWAVRWHPNYFLGSWVLELTAHSDRLRHYDGGDGTVGIHGRGGASLLDPLGSALSHGCIRLANGSIDWLVATVSANWLAGTPVQVS